MNSKRLSVGKVIVYIVLSLGAVIMVLPFLWTVLSSLKNMGADLCGSTQDHPGSFRVGKLSGVPAGAAFWTGLFQ